MDVVQKLYENWMPRRSRNLLADGVRGSMTVALCQRREKVMQLKHNFQAGKKRRSERFTLPFSLLRQPETDGLPSPVSCTDI
jgi:hypothetical protein